MSRLPHPAGTAALAVLAFLGCSAPHAAPHAAARPEPRARRVIVVSFDAFNEARFRAAADSATAPALHAFLGEAACADGARPAFPSKTAPGHASLWTGSYGNRDGIAVNWQSLLPLDQHTLLEQGSGFLAAGLRAEPIWVTAGLAGRRVATDQATQTPDAPGFPPRWRVGDPDSATLARERARGERAVALPTVALLNGYNRTIAEDQVITEASGTPRPGPAWQHAGSLERADAGARELAVALGAGGDSLYLLFVRGAGGYDAVLVAPGRDVSAAVRVHPAPADTSWPASRALARHFSAPVRLRAGGETLPVSVRLFALAPDLSRFLLFVPALQVMEANEPGLGAAYVDAIGGWVGNSAAWLYADGRFGPRLDQGGDGTAEAMWMETAEYLIRQEIRGATWLARRATPDLLVEYSPLIDDTDHVLYGRVSPAVPGHDARVAAALQRVRRRAYALVDRRLAGLREMARESGAVLVLASDHGMRATWRGFRPNVLLQQDGLLALDGAGRVDLARTRAWSPDGFFVVVNRSTRKGGIVAPGDEAAVVDAAQRALARARGDDGEPVLTDFWRPGANDSLGIGGPVGGDLYYEFAPGYYPDGGLHAPAVRATRPAGGHGFPSVATDMQAIFCAAGPGIIAGRFARARTIDVGPTVLDYLGVAPASTMQGRSLLHELMRR